MPNFLAIRITRPMDEHFNAGHPTRVSTALSQNQVEVMLDPKEKGKGWKKFLEESNLGDVYLARLDLTIMRIGQTFYPTED